MSLPTNQRINRELRPLENRLKKILLNFYNDKISNSLTPVESLKQKYDKRLKLVISKSIQDSYMVAIDLIQRQTGKAIPISLTTKDFNNIDRLVNEAATAFWITAKKLRQREIEFYTEKELETNRIAATIHLFDKLAVMVGNAAKAVFSAFNTGIVSKLSEVKELVSGDLELQEIATFSNQVQFTTAGDSKVDPAICEPLAGNIYDVNDPDIPEPPLHLHCRCRLLPI